MIEKKAKKSVPSRKARKQALGWDIWTNLIISYLILVKNEEKLF